MKLKKFTSLSILKETLKRSSAVPTRNSKKNSILKIKNLIKKLHLKGAISNNDKIHYLYLVNDLNEKGYLNRFEENRSLLDLYRTIGKIDTKESIIFLNNCFSLFNLEVVYLNDPVYSLKLLCPIVEDDSVFEFACDVIHNCRDLSGDELEEISLFIDSLDKDDEDVDLFLSKISILTIAHRFGIDLSKVSDQRIEKGKMINLLEEMWDSRQRHY
ncbi:MAG: hypothetical protein GY909_16050 [Oligoflexia bacterium]|nr:hypothetical protein [Oligoflexia bacterium]